jgi:NADH:ubiquinone oxidoreductase subunit F (NADH-binding)
MGAIAQVKQKGLLGIGGHPFEIELRLGTGGYVCGEETAMMEYLEGRRGEPRVRPPFPPSQGLLGLPTVINNVETLMNIPWIVENGADRFCEIGTPQSKGTKVFCVSGDVERPGVYELEMGSSLGELVEGLAVARDIKMIQVGGASGRIVPADKMDVLLSYETVLGPGPVIVFDKTRDVVDIMWRTMEFFAEESCGKCAPCREGTQAMLETLARIADGKGVRKDLKSLEELSRAMMLTSSCGLGQAAPFPVVDSLRYFGDEYEAHISA